MIFLRELMDVKDRSKMSELWQIVCKKYNFNISAFVGFSILIAYYYTDTNSIKIQILHFSSLQRKNNPITSLDRPWGFQEVEAPRFQDNRHMKVVRLVTTTHRPPLPPGSIPGTHVFYRLSRPQGHSAAGRIISMKNCIDTMGNRTRDLPACGAVPQPTASPRAPVRYKSEIK